MMHSTITSKGQTTIPAEIRKALKLKPHQRITYELQGKTVIFKADDRNALDLYGCLKSDRHPPTKKEMREIVHRSIADNAAKEGRT